MGSVGIVRAVTSGVLVMTAVVMVASACSGADGDPESQAVEYVVGWEGTFAGGLDPDLGWESHDVYVTDDGKCAAVSVRSSDGLSLVMLLANRDKLTIEEV